MTLDNLMTLGMLILLQAVLGFDNLLYVSLESKRAPAAKQAMVRRLGIGLDLIGGGLAAMGTVPGRFEQVPNERGITAIVDYAHTPEAVASAIATATEVASRRVIAVVGSAGDRDPDKRAPMGAAAALQLNSEQSRSQRVEGGSILDSVPRRTAHHHPKGFGPWSSPQQWASSASSSPSSRPPAAPRRS